MDRVPAKPSDIPVDCIVTEKEIIDCKANRAAGAQGEKITPIRVVVLASGRGRLLVGQGTVLTAALIEKVLNFHKIDPITYPVEVIAQPA